MEKNSSVGLATLDKFLPDSFSEELVEQLRKKSSRKRHLIFREYVYGHKDKEKFVFDIENYGITQWLDIMEKQASKVDCVIGDTIIEYYSDGSREVKPAEVPILLSPNTKYWASKQKYTTKNEWATMEQMLKLFRKDPYIQELDEKYPYLKENGRFRLNEDLDSFELAMVPYNARWVFGDKNYIIRKGEFSSLGNLLYLFKMYYKIIQSKDYKKIDELMASQAITAYYPNQQTATCHLLVGYTNLPYDVAAQCVDDQKMLRRVYLQQGEPLSVTLGRNVITRKCNDFSQFSELHGSMMSGDFVFEPEVFKNWAADFSPAELAIICRDRFFDYYNPDMDIDKQRKLIKKHSVVKTTSKMLALWK